MKVLKNSYREKIIYNGQCAMLHNILSRTEQPDLRKSLKKQVIIRLWRNLVKCKYILITLKWVIKIKML